MPLLVVHGAKIACTGCPGAASQLHVTSPTGVTTTQMCLSAASITDHIPVVNVVPFASCVFLEGAPCVPATPSPWTGAILGPPFLSIAPVLTAAHQLTCEIGGRITIQDPGQHSVEVGDIAAPEPEEEDRGFFAELWDDGWLLLDVAMVVGDVVTIPSGEAAAGIALRRGARKLAKQGLKAAVKRRARTGPKPWPHGPHNQKIDQRIKELIKKGHKHRAGGSKTEEVIPTPKGGKKSRRPDITTEAPDGTIYRENVGRTDKHGNPIPREQQALDDLARETGTKPGYTPYDR